MLNVSPSVVFSLQILQLTNCSIAALPVSPGKTELGAISTLQLVKQELLINQQFYGFD
jgi:hypothetical protein